MEKRQTIKFLPNKPETVTFEFDQPRTGEGNYGPWNLYGVEGNKSFFAPFGLNARLEALGQLKGRTLTITKNITLDDNQKELTRWTIEENGSDITPQVEAKAPAAQKSAPVVQYVPVEKWNKFVEGFTAWKKETDEIIEDLVKFKANTVSKNAASTPYEDIPTVKEEDDIDVSKIPF
jgi:hypothetical protein